MRDLLLFVAVALGVAACGETGDPAGPALESVEVAFRTAGELQGIAGETVPGPLEVKTTEDDGTPAPDVPVELSVLDGGGEVVPRSTRTNISGEVPVRWTLGPAETAVQHLEVRVRGPDGASADTVAARALGPDETDVVVARGSRGPMKGLVFLVNLGAAVQPVGARVDTDTVMPILPRDAGADTLAVFPTANPPVLLEAEWTPGIDTVVAELSPPVELDLRIQIHAGPYEERREVAERHLSVTREIFTDQGAGVKLGSVTFVDRTGGEGEININSETICQDRSTSTRTTILVQYIHSVNGDAIWGYGCAPDHAWLGLPSERDGEILAHELGHVLALQHRSGGLMEKGGTGRTLTDGEIFWLHFDERSAVNVLFDGHPEPLRRRCNLGISGRCLPLDFDLE